MNLEKKSLKYNTLKSTPMVVPIPCAASQVFKNLSGKFVKVASGYATIADSGDTSVLGWAQVGEHTSVSSNGGETIGVDICVETVHEIPVDATITAATGVALVGKTCDLIVASNIQKADIGESNEDVILIVGYNVTAQTVYVTLNPAKVGAGNGVV